MGEREELGEELNALLEDYLNNSHMSERHQAAATLREALWDNKAGIIAHLRAPAQSRQEPGTFDCPCGCGRKVISATGEAALRAPEAADLSARNNAIHLQEQLDCEVETTNRLVRGIRSIKDYLEEPSPRVGDANFVCDALLAGHEDIAPEAADAGAVAWQYRWKSYDGSWLDWHDCSVERYNRVKQSGIVGDREAQGRALVASPAAHRGLAADAGAIRSKITDILQSEISTPGEDYVDLGDAVDLLADLYASPTDAWMRAALECARQAIEYSIDMGGTDPGGVLLQALNKVDHALAVPSTERGAATSWDDCIHDWAEVDFDLGGARTAVKCKKCQCPGERDDNTSEIYWPAT